MSLLDEQFEDFTIINKAVVDDGYGGTKTVWTPGAVIKGVMAYNNNLAVQVAQIMGSTTNYVFVVRKDTEVDYYTVLRRDSDGKIFRITANSDDKKTPKSAGLNMREYDAEEWKLTT